MVGIDSGLTVTKAVIFDIDGTILTVARRRITQLIPNPHYVERDLRELWQAPASEIREVIEKSGRNANDVTDVAATAHGDGIFLLDKNRQVLDHSILCLHGRAGRVVTEFDTNGTAAQTPSPTGQQPVAASSSALTFPHNLIHIEVMGARSIVETGLA